MIKTYDSVADLRQAYLDSGARQIARTNMQSWYNNETPDQTLKLTELGDRTLVPKAEQLLDQLESQIEVPRKVWQASPAGSYACIPDYLRGIPTSMRRQVEIGDEHAPISILVCSSCSAGINSETMLNRGVTILALVMALARIRPISLWTVATLHGQDTGETILSTQINTTPLDLATACYVLTSAGFCRRITYNLGTKLNNFNGSWPRNFKYSQPKPYYDYLARVLSPDPKRCLVIGTAQLGDELLSQPLIWIKNQIQRFTSSKEGQ